MKALQMLDHVCLWIARIFLGSIFLASLFLLSRNSESGNTLFLTEIQNTLFTLGFLLWLISSFFLHNSAIRFCFGFGSSLFFAFFVYHAVKEILDIPFYNGLLDFAWHIALVLFPMPEISLLSTASMIWISIRPPQNLTPSNSKSPDNSPSSNFVNSVCIP